MQSTYKLYYFGANAKAAIARAVLTYAGAKWENIVIQREEWPALKNSGKCEFGQLPLLEVDGKYYAQSLAQTLYLGNKFGLNGSNADEEYQIVSLLVTADDYSSKFRNFFNLTEEQKLKLAENTKEMEVTIALYWGAYEKRFGSTGGNYFIGNKITLADFFVVTMYKSFAALGFEEAVKKTAPKVTELVEKLSQGDLAKYLNDVHNKASF